MPAAPGGAAVCPHYRGRGGRRGGGPAPAPPGLPGAPGVQRAGGAAGQCGQSRGGRRQTARRAGGRGRGDGAGGQAAPRCRARDPPLPCKRPPPRARDPPLLPGAMKGALGSATPFRTSLKKHPFRGFLGGEVLFALFFTCFF